MFGVTSVVAIDGHSGFVVVARARCQEKLYKGIVNFFTFNEKYVFTRTILLKRNV